MHNRREEPAPQQVARPGQVQTVGQEQLGPRLPGGAEHGREDVDLGLQAIAGERELTHGC